MLLPNADQAVVEEPKVAEYLLSPDHPDGRSKAEFFNRFGFRREAWQVLADALRQHGAAYPVAKSAHSAWGTRYSADGELNCPDGRCPRIRTVWIVEDLGSGIKLVPRLITAYPV